MRKKLFLSAIILPAFLITWLFFQQPSHDRDWEVGQEGLPSIIFNEDDVTINNYRNFVWHKDGKIDNVYETKSFKLSDLETVDVIISHFDDFEGLAHIFISFGSKTGEHIIMSLETRREKGEEFSPYWGIMRQFEIIYVVGSEEDVIGLRTNVRGERVYLYPTISTPEKTRALFIELANEINNIYKKPKIYNTLTHNCTNEITRRVEKISELDFPATWKSIFPGYFDEILYEMEIIPADKPFLDIKNSYLIDNLKVDHFDDDYSNQIRKMIN